MYHLLSVLLLVDTEVMVDITVPDINQDDWMEKIQREVLLSGYPWYLLKGLTHTPLARHVTSPTGHHRYLHRVSLEGCRLDGVPHLNRLSTVLDGVESSTPMYEGSVGDSFPVRDGTMFPSGKDRSYPEKPSR